MGQAATQPFWEVESAKVAESPMSYTGPIKGGGARS